MARHSDHCRGRTHQLQQMEFAQDTSFSFAHRSRAISLCDRGDATRCKKSSRGIEYRLREDKKIDI
jgi:hypothetical protein